jgi:hypothetical protein
MEDSDPAKQAMEQQLYGTRRAGSHKLGWVDSVAQDARNMGMTGRKQHKIGKDGGDFLRKPRPDKGCSATDDDDDGNYLYHLLQQSLPLQFVFMADV